MASFAGYPQTVNFQTVNVSAGGGSENLLINPRGKINQASEADGVLAPGQYFCDGWKAGANGAEVYIDEDGFRLISGSILQLVPNNLEAGRTIRGNMDTLSGAPVISINGGSDNVLSDNAEYIQFEVSGDNSKFTRLILAESVSLPIYQQSINELITCFKFLRVFDYRIHRYLAENQFFVNTEFVNRFHKVPACTYSSMSVGTVITPNINGFQWNNASSAQTAAFFVDGLILDARP